ncbi:CLUMA_CG021364, isoform A [Clunio marinus]|uniref:CLUMA_CG021364, isoform A n=1 Tax=Clunio marinus TaxID=568069 RepID=A0A1J1JBE2_9DIPT|nr:CLUMA_CG021364, isoform A [Clunio marinus]
MDIERIEKHFKTVQFTSWKSLPQNSSFYDKKHESKSFERNQSFPKVHQHHHNEIISEAVVNNNLKKRMDKIRVDGFNGLRFTPIRKSKGCFTGSSYSGSILNPKSGINPNKAVFTIDSKTSNILIVNKNACDLLGYQSRELCDSGVKFSNLLACKNKIHVSALAENQFNSEDGTMILLSGKVVEMIHKNGAKLPVSLWIRQIDGHDGRCLAVAEPVERRVAQINVDSHGIVINGDNEALMLFQLDSLETFIGMDVTLLIPAIQLPTEPIENHLIPKNLRKQRATGKTQDGVSFPLCLMISTDESINEPVDSLTAPSYTITIWVYSNLSGLIVIDENSIIESCNHHFSTLMFGYSQSRIIGQNIFKLIPNFGQEFEYIDARSQRSPSIENEESETETDHVLLNDPFVIGTVLNSKKDPFKICLDFTSPRNSIRSPDVSLIKLSNLSNTENDKNVMNLVNGDVSDEQELLTPVNEMGHVQLNDSTSTQDEIVSNKSQQYDNSTHTTSNLESTPKGIKTSTVTTTILDGDCQKSLITSTPDIGKRLSIGTQNNAAGIQQFNYNYADGKYKGEAVHSDGNIIDIVYTIYKHTLPSTNNTIYLVWICRDPDEYRNEDPDEEKQFNLTLTLNSIENSLGNATVKTGTAASSVCVSNAASSIMMTSAGTIGTSTLANITSVSRPNSLSIVSQCEDEQISGEYAKNYTTLKQIGKGAYGYVKMAYRNTDRLLVISKFILKEKLCSNFMITTEDKKEIPMEIYLLKRVKHPNIVNVLDVYENEKFFQLIMEKHGSGMDLFEFIDRRPLMDEKLGCFIFRQIAKAVDYLHSLKILHRDIKDENIIIDQNFHIKLIDFGSATFMEDGKMFSTFYGTTEYCSPEVLAGNKYHGPELEVWSLGVTLFVLMFFENPFLDMEDTLRADLMIPQDVTVDLEDLLFRMLDKDPKTRLSMKELLAHEWIVQEITNNFDFASIVPCDEHEAHPDIYYSGQVFSSATALSTSHDSLSLADDESICEDIDDVNFDGDGTSTSNSLLKVSQNFNDNNSSDDIQNISNRSSINRSKTETSSKVALKGTDEDTLWESHYCSRSDAFEDN